MKSVWKRVLVLILVLAVTAGALTSGVCAATVPAAYDETYYATLDYYGGVREASVVKSYRLNGATSLTDYGAYDQVVNLTDDLVPVVDGSAVTFDLGEEAPEKFYFEGKTMQPFEDLPWNISVSYKLNGAPIQAEDLAGKTGLVEIALDVTVNSLAPEYNRTNLVLTAAAVFNDDDITSLEAPGAEVQMIGNLRTVLFMVLPGEEQHFVIRVGSEDFSFSGLILLAVPATLQQLEQVAELKEAKEKGEDSLESIGNSVDRILNVMEGMSGGLNAAAGGLDRLNSARETVSAGKHDVYTKADIALGDLDALANTLGNLDKYADTTSQAITDLNGTLNGLNDTVQGLGPELANTRKTITAIQKDTKAMADLLEDVESYNKQATSIASSLADELDELDENLEGLEHSLRVLRNALDNTNGLSRMDQITIGGMTNAAQIQSAVTAAKTAHAQYEAAMAAGMLPAGTTFQQSIILSAYQEYATAVVTQVITQAAAQGVTLTAEEAKVKAVQEGLLPATPEDFARNTLEGQQAAIKAEGAEQLYEATKNMTAAEMQEQLKTLEMMNTQVIPVVNSKITEVNRLVTGLTYPTADVVDELADIVENVGDVGVTDDLASLAKLCRDLLKTMKEHEGEGASALEHADELGDLAARVTSTGDDLLARMDELNGVLNTYEPEVQSAVTDIQTLSGSAQSTLHDIAASLSAAEELLRAAGPELDEGTREALSGVSDSLRRAAAGLNEVDAIRDAKNTVKDLIDDEWDAHSGQIDGLLNIDAGAAPVSMTDPRNPTPGSIQYIMRTQEIKKEKKAEETAQQQETAAKTTFWERVVAMFLGIWDGFRKLLHI